jgi:hypothetical protein
MKLELFYFFSKMDLWYKLQTQLKYLLAPLPESFKMLRKPLTLLYSIAFLLLCVVFALLSETMEWGRETAKNEQDFQKLAHGLGIGATTVPAWCYINFDPRRDARCTCIEWPIPGGYCYCPDHTGTVSFISGKVDMGAEIRISK